MLPSHAGLGFSWDSFTWKIPSRILRLLVRSLRHLNADRVKLIVAQKKITLAQHPVVALLQRLTLNNVEITPISSFLLVTGIHLGGQ